MYLRNALCLLLVAVISIGNCSLSDNVTVIVNSENITLGYDEGIVEETTEIPEQTFQEAEKEILDFVNSLLKQLLPKVVGGSGAAELSPKCIAGMMKIFGNVRRLKGWTIKMIDSLGKTTPGILMGTSYTMGNYDECLDLSISSKGEETSDPSQEMFRGKYCRIKIQLRKTVVETAEEYQHGLKNASDLRKLKEVIQFVPYIRIDLPYLTHFTGLCFPSTCSNHDINFLAGLVPFPGSASLDRCDVKTEVEVENYQLLIICIFLFLVLLASLSTSLDWWSHSGNNKPTDEDHDKRCVSVSLCFSICNNSKRLMKNIEEDTDGLLSGKCVRGICVVAVVWVIVGTTYFFPSKAFYMQTANLRNLHTYWNEAYFTIIQAYPLAFDVLLVC
nr:nose resistant to fluoxetine protein 6-like [Parasteatoda tepidariorum]